MSSNEWRENKWLNIIAAVIFAACAGVIAFSIVHKRLIEKRNFEREFQEWQSRRHAFDEEGHIIGDKGD